MLKRTVLDGLVYAIAAVLYRGLLVLQVPLFARVLTPEDFGAIDLVEAVVTLINLTVALEVSQAVGVFFSTSQDAREKRAMASTSLWFTLGAYALFICASLLFSNEVTRLIFGSESRVNLTFLMLGYSFANGLFLLSHNLLRWMLRPWRFFGVAVAHGIVSVLAAAVFVYGFNMGSAGVLSSQIIAGLVGAAASIALSREFYGLIFDREVLKRMLHFSGPLVFSSAAVFASMFVDRFCIQRFLGLNEVGHYGVTYRLASVVGIVVVGFSRAFTPLIYSRYKEDGAPLHVAQCLSIFTAMGVAIIGILAAFAPFLTDFLAGPSYRSSAQLVPLLAASIILGGMYIFAPGLAIEKRSKEIALISIAGASLNLILNLLFIPVFGLFGAAYATVISSACTAIAWLVRGQRWYKIPFAKRELLSILAVLAVIWISAGPISTANWSIKVLFLVAVLLFLYLPLRSLFDSMSKSIAKKID
jgi:O-antigen/teichoic acid export membrane protein